METEHKFVIIINKRQEDPVTYMCKLRKYELGSLQLIKNLTRKLLRCKL